MSELMNGARLTVNAPPVIHETIDGEAIVINLSTGIYYSLKGTAAEAWALIQRPQGVVGAELVETFADYYGMPAGELDVSLSPFLTELVTEGLVAVGDGARPAVAAVADAPAVETAETRSFEPPRVDKFDDMQDLVLLDPVHEVGEMGWPLRLEDAAGVADS